MKTLRQLCAVCVLTLAFALTAFAGNMSTGIAEPPPPPPQEMTQGDMGAGITGNIEAGVTTTDTATDVLLSLLQSWLSLF